MDSFPNWWTLYMHLSFCVCMCRCVFVSLLNQRMCPKKIREWRKWKDSTYERRILETELPLRIYASLGICRATSAVLQCVNASIGLKAFPTLSVKEIFSGYFVFRFLLFSCLKIHISPLMIGFYLSLCIQPFCHLISERDFSSERKMSRKPFWAYCLRVSVSGKSSILDRIMLACYSLEDLNCS